MRRRTMRTRNGPAPTARVQSLRSPGGRSYRAGAFSAWFPDRGTLSPPRYSIVAGERNGSCARAVIHQATLADCGRDFSKNFWPLRGFATRHEVANSERLTTLVMSDSSDWSPLMAIGGTLFAIPLGQHAGNCSLARLRAVEPINQHVRINCVHAIDRETNECPEHRYPLRHRAHRIHRAPARCLFR